MNTKSVHAPRHRSGDVENAVRDVCSGLDTPRSLAVYLLFSNKEHNQLLGLKCDPMSYCDSSLFADDYLATEMLKKYPYLETGIDTRSVALEKFLECESHCRNVNTRLRTQSLTGVPGEIIHRARKICERVLGVTSEAFGYPTLSMEIMSNLGWGNGVTSSVKGRRLSSYHKLQGKLEATPDLIAAGAHYLVNSVPMWATYHGSGNPDSPSSVTPLAFTSKPGNAVTFVAKNAKTDRPIAIEPHVNAALQRGIGIAIRKRLRRFGVNLRDQTRNQTLARSGSVTGHLATVDLSSASDTVSQGIVELLIPREWKLWLDVSRSPSYTLDGKQWNQYHKYSSMGNGYTFELETLVFYSLAISTCRQFEHSISDVSVYGDDIVIPSALIKPFREVLEHAGFIVNEDKTFSSGPFRESCGKDYFLGVPVRPFFFRENVVSSQSRFRLANAIRRYSAMRCANLACDGRFLRAWRTLYLSAPSSDRGMRCPDGVGDGGFIGNFDECAISARVHFQHGRAGGSQHSPRVYPRRSVDGYLYVSMVERAATGRKRDVTVSVASALWDSVDVDSHPCYNPVVPTDKTVYSLSKSTTTRRLVSLARDWPSLGPWV